MERAMEDIIVDAIKEKAQNRTLVLWGGWEKENGLRDYILQYTSLQFAFCVTTKKIDHEILKEAIYEA